MRHQRSTIVPVPHLVQTITASHQTRGGTPQVSSINTSVPGVKVIRGVHRLAIPLTPHDPANYSATLSRSARSGGAPPREFAGAVSRSGLNRSPCRVCATFCVSIKRLPTSTQIIAVFPNPTADLLPGPDLELNMPARWALSHDGLLMPQPR